MALVREFTTPSGVRVRIMDDAYARCTPEELAERHREVRRVLNEIAYSIARRAAERGQADGKDGADTEGRGGHD